jgi:hypothetical protein
MPFVLLFTRGNPTQNGRETWLNSSVKTGKVLLNAIYIL